MNFDESISNGVFAIPWCSLCNTATWPPSESCHICHENITSKPSTGCGRIIEYSKDDQGYFCIVEFEPTVRIMCRILGKGIPECAYKERDPSLTAVHPNVAFDCILPDIRAVCFFDVAS